ncbi:hypothetical protein LMG28614_05318 [Paraburkholderia ultramafica]|uniref:Uncharacterized protein n=1 Tax=Paraburkholderia ultramafica TaxID=1544867 RepID=A0A6S7BIB1_9BURK|nr:hypothetical protein [Paraburkholderia ultramafica]CAB3801080.1 hypothetical protein LMG28614_05318 [Paraburkholderia ultramafica]
MKPEKRVPLLDPVDRVSEILFGLIMAVTIVGSVSIGSATRDPGKAATVMTAQAILAQRGKPPDRFTD